MRDRPILMLALAQMLIWACIYYSFPALLLHWEKSLGWSRADLTAAITLAVFVSAFCSPLYGRLIDAGKGALMMTVATLVGGCCMMLLTQVEYRWQFYLIWGVLGVCMSGSLYEPCFALITRARGEQARRSIIFVTLVAGFAGTVSFPVAHSLAGAFGWRTSAHRKSAFLAGGAVLPAIAGVLVPGARLRAGRRDARRYPAPPVADSR